MRQPVADVMSKFHGLMRVEFYVARAVSCDRQRPGDSCNGNVMSTFNKLTSLANSSDAQRN